MLHSLILCSPGIRIRVIQITIVRAVESCRRRIPTAILRRDRISTPQVLRLLLPTTPMNLEPGMSVRPSSISQPSWFMKRPGQGDAKNLQVFKWRSVWPSGDITVFEGILFKIQWNLKTNNIKQKYVRKPYCEKVCLCQSRRSDLVGCGVGQLLDLRFRQDKSEVHDKLLAEWLCDRLLLDWASHYVVICTEDLVETLHSRHPPHAE